MTLRCALASIVVVLASAKTHSAGGGNGLPSSRRRQNRERRASGRRTLLSAFQVSEPVFELAPHEYADGKPYLLQFKGKGDDYCASMEPLKEQLKEELGVNIRCFEVWYDSKNLELFQRYDRGRCGGVPFFYNKRSRRFICGATTYENLKNWALCEPCEPFLPPPNLNADKEPEQNKVQKFFGRISSMAREKMAGRETEDEDEEEAD